MLSRIKIQHHLEIKYLVSKLVTISFDVLMCGNACYRNTKKCNSGSIPQIPAPSKRFTTEM